MQIAKYIAVAVFGSLISPMGAAFAQTSQTPHGPLVYSGDAILFAPGYFPKGHVITEEDRQTAQVQLNVMHERINSLNHDAAQALYQKNYALAETDARLSKSLGQDSGIANDVLAQALEGEGKDQEALQQYKSLLKGIDDPNLTPTQVANTYSHYLIPYAQLLLKAGQWAQAVDAYNKAIPPLTQEDVDNYKKGSYSDNYMLRASSHFSADTQQPEELATALHIARGLGYERSDWAGHMQDDKAMDQFDQAVQVSPNSDLANYYRGYGIREAAGHKPRASAVKSQTGVTDAASTK